MCVLMSSVDSSDSEFGTIDLRGAFYVIELKISVFKTIPK
jgi:hypothetical protein